MTTKNKDYLYFKTHASLYQWVEAAGVDIDISKSINGSRFTVHINGERKFNHNLPTLIHTLNLHLPQGSKLDPVKSVVKGKIGYLCYLLEGEASSKVAVKAEVKPAVVEAALVEEDSETLEDTVNTPDWDHVASLKDDSNKAESKDALEAYAREFAIELSKNKKFDNMVAEFKAAL